MATSMTWQKAKMDKDHNNRKRFALGGFAQHSQKDVVGLSPDGDRRNGGYKRIEAAKPISVETQDAPVVKGQKAWASGLSHDIGRMGARRATLNKSGCTSHRMLNTKPAQLYTFEQFRERYDMQQWEIVKR